MDKYNKEQNLHCRYCNRECKNINSLRQHEVRCKSNPNHIICHGNKGNFPKQLKDNNNEYVVTRNADVIDITYKQLNEYKLIHTTCEICGKTLNESVKWSSKFAPKSLCVDHDHITLKFRGLLCSVCNRQLGWYENNKDKIEQYLHKGN